MFRFNFQVEITFNSELLFILLTRNTSKRIVFTLYNTNVTQFVTPCSAGGGGRDFKGLADKALNKMKKKTHRNDNGQGNRAFRNFSRFSFSFWQNCVCCTAWYFDSFVVDLPFRRKALALLSNHVFSDADTALWKEVLFTRYAVFVWHLAFLILEYWSVKRSGLNWIAEL